MTTTTEDVRTSIARLRDFLADAEVSNMWGPDVARAVDLAEQITAWAAERRTGRFWLVPKRPHDPDAVVGPRVRAGVVLRAAGVSDPEHTRIYAAQLLAAADAAEEVGR